MKEANAITLQKEYSQMIDKYKKNVGNDIVYEGKISFMFLRQLIYVFEHISLLCI